MELDAAKTEEEEHIDIAGGGGGVPEVHDC